MTIVVPRRRGKHLSDVTFKIDAATGLIEPARRCPSPNQDARPDGSWPELLIVHGISLPPGEFGGPQVEQLFTNTLDWDSHPYSERFVLCPNGLLFLALTTRDTFV